MLAKPPKIKSGLLAVVMDGVAAVALVPVAIVDVTSLAVAPEISILENSTTVAPAVSGVPLRVNVAVALPEPVLKPYQISWSILFPASIPPVALIQVTPAPRELLTVTTVEVLGHDKLTLANTASPAVKVPRGTASVVDLDETALCCWIKIGEASAIDMRRKKIKKNASPPRARPGIKIKTLLKNFEIMDCILTMRILFTARTAISFRTNYYYYSICSPACGSG